MRSGGQQQGEKYPLDSEVEVEDQWIPGGAGNPVYGR
jgi:hypothetical protein